MKKTISLQIPMGYKLEDKIEYVKIWQAESYLLSKRVRRYTKAVRHDTDAELHSRWLICPYCGKEYVANVTSPAFAKSDNRQYLRFSKPTKEQIKNWGSLQLTLFDEHDNSELFIASAIDVSGKFTCLNCENESYESSSKRQVMVTLNRKKISVKCEVVQIDEILSLGWIKAKEVRISFPIYEILTFDCHKGKVHVRIENSQGNVLCQRDVSAYPEQLKGGAVHKVLTQNKVVLRNVKRLFQEVWGVNLPYCWKQLDIPALFKMTMFVGYHKSFYDSIPYMQNSFRIDRGFRARAKRMHFAEKLIGLYQKSGLPHVKSIRRIMFSTPGLFFYIYEIKRFWDAIGDYNLLSRLLLSERIYEILSSIHMRPGIMEYICDYCKVKGPVYLLANISDGWESTRKEAIDYCCMSQRLRMEAQHRWAGRHSCGSEVSEIAYSVPMCKPDEKIKDCTIDGFAFCWLRNSNDYAIASEHLQNCLDEWQPYDSPVVGVRKKEKYVAAIEIFKGCVVQAHGYDNRSLDSDPTLNKAFEKWMARFNLEWGEKEEYFDVNGAFRFFEHENMPF